MATVYMSEFADDETPTSFDYGETEIMSEESHPRTLYVGNLDASVSEDLVCALFSQIGPVKGCKIIREIVSCKMNFEVPLYLAAYNDI